MWRLINRSQGKKRSNGISIVEVPNDGVWEKIEEQLPAEQALMEHLSACFHLTKSTPLMSDYMRRKLGTLAQSEFFKLYYNEHLMMIRCLMYTSTCSSNL